MAIHLAVEEAITNAIKHGNQSDPAKCVSVAFSITSERFDITVTDEGDGFDPGADEEASGVHSLRRACGRGILLMHAFMTDVRFLGRGNVVRMSKVREVGT